MIDGVIPVYSEALPGDVHKVVCCVCVCVCDTVRVCVHMCVIVCV